MGGGAGAYTVNKKWERDPQCKDWVSVLKVDKQKALCQWCYRTIDVSSMGECAEIALKKARSTSKTDKLKFQTRKAKRIDTIKALPGVCVLISCTTLMAVSCLYNACSLQNISYKKSFELQRCQPKGIKIREIANLTFFDPKERC